MKEKKNSTKLKDKPHRIKFPSIKRPFILPLVIILSSVVLASSLIFSSRGSIGIQTPSLSFPNLVNRSKFNALKDINDYSDFIAIKNSQPSLTINSEKKYYLIELCNLYNTLCKNFHSVTSNQPNRFERIIEDYVKTGKVSYTWIDSTADDKTLKNETLYCALDQDIKLFPEIISKLSQESLVNFTKENALSFASSNKLSKEIFEKCLNDKKYQERVKNLSLFAKSVNKGEEKPTLLYLVRIDTKTIQKIDGSKTREETAIYITRIEGTKDYEQTIKPALDSYLQ